MTAIPNPLAHAVALTGSIVTFGDNRQGKVITVDGPDWMTTYLRQADSVHISFTAAPLPDLDDPMIMIESVEVIGHSEHWTTMSQVRRGVCIRKGATKRA